MAETSENPTWLARQWDRLRATARRPADAEKILADARARAPAPTFWLFGKTQSGKSSLVRYLTGASAADVGSGYRPCTKTTNRYPFPLAIAPLMTFLDTRGLDDPAYDPTVDIRELDASTHLMIVTVKLTDLAQRTVRTALEQVRRANPRRPVLLVLTCLHEAYPLQPHPDPYPFADPANPVISGDVPRLIGEHERVFAGLFDSRVVIDFTKPEEGFADPHYGGPELKAAILHNLPAAYAETLLRFEGASDRLRSAHVSAAVPVIAGYATAAAAAAAVPIPFVDLVAIPAVQAQMVNHLARMYDQPLTGERFRELAASLGVGLVTRQAIRELAKVIPVIGSVAASALAAASTFALGRAFCEYLHDVKAGHRPDAADLKRLYERELRTAERLWRHPGATE
ncbi:MAG TPA: DUF697 domain-containing protein [Fimbriiglobus sp.]|jgi:uncharacterized protein (DUF697 family)